MSSKQQYKDVIKRNKLLIATLITENKKLKVEITRAGKIINNYKQINNIRKKWWQIWK